MIKFTVFRFLPALLLAALCLTGPRVDQSMAAEGGEVLVFAAASTTNAVTDIGKLYEQKGLGKVVCSFASSSTLAKQIEQGAPAAVFLSANLDWMDYLDERGLVAPGSRKNLLRNRIALIVPASSPVTSIDIKEGLDLLTYLGADGRLAVGDPAHVPLGMYGKQALMLLGLWNSVADRLAPAKDVRAGMALVERGEAPLGLVYSSDVSASDGVRIVGLFPESSHPEIIYPVGAIKGDKAAEAQKFIDFLSTPEAKAIFKQYGFDAQ